MEINLSLIDPNVHSGVYCFTVAYEPTKVLLPKAFQFTCLYAFYSSTYLPQHDRWVAQLACGRCLIRALHWHITRGRIVREHAHMGGEKLSQSIGK